jgi:OmcA/MtrC family decaheme c-type cytochrome
VLKFASVDGSKIAERRKSVDLAKCNECHGFLNLHGTNRNTVESCLICHNPTMTDAARRPADKAPAESIQMANMVHKIHMGKGNTEEYTLYGFGNTPHNYNKVGYPGDLASCAECHINDSQSLPLPAGLLTVTDPRSYINPAGPATAACLGCHTSKEAASHALANTSALGESCSVCHGRTSEYSVNKVHAR